jgi:hypothetical protein
LAAFVLVMTPAATAALLLVSCVQFRLKIAAIHYL